MAPKAHTLLLALGGLVLFPGLTSSLVLAQSDAPVPAAEPAPVLEPVPPPTPPPALPPLTSAPAASAPAPAGRPGPQEASRPAPRVLFDQRLDELDSNGAFTAAERAGRIRTHRFLNLPSAQRREACDSGALSQVECRTGLVMRGRGRADAPISFEGGEVVAGGNAASGYLQGASGFRTDASPLPPISVPVTALLSGAGGSFRLTDVFARTPRPAPIAGNGNASLLFPLIGSAVTTSEFGWRLHPLMGTWLMHAGRDLAAPEGTPVVAALSGRVVSSGLAGGYGLAIEVEHDNPRRRTLYGHLSELYVREGQMVRQGEVIGRVGSTGLSTGPHLHFELRLPQEGGWVAVDPGELDPGGLFAAARAGQPGMPGMPTDAVALLMGQLIASLERPISPLGQPRGAGAPMPPQRQLPRPAPLPPPNNPG